MAGERLSSLRTGSGVTLSLLPTKNTGRHPEPCGTTGGSALSHVSRAPGYRPSRAWMSRMTLSPASVGMSPGGPMSALLQLPIEILSFQSPYATRLAHG